jgi:hypothetical protein
MPYEISFIEKSGIVIIENKGELTYDEVVTQSKEAIILANEKNSQLFLSDFSNVKVRANTFELLKFPEIYKQYGMSRTSRIAVVVTNIELKTEELRFYETICLNRGWQIKIFLKRDRAIEWLEKKN